jgi:hypothetical protein
MYFRTEANDQQPATSNQQPATSNQQPATSNQQPATSNQQPATSNNISIPAHIPEPKHKPNTVIHQYFQTA